MNNFKELIESNLLYQYLTDKLDIPSNLYHLPLSETCTKLELDHTFIETLLLSYDESHPFPTKELEQFSIHCILDYLKKSHHFYLYKKLPEIELSAKYLCINHFKEFPLLPLLTTFFIDYKKKLEQHILFEEAIFFPYIEELLVQAEFPNPFKTRFPNFSTKLFLKGHTDIESGLSEIRKQLVKYNPENTKNTPLPYRVFLTQLHFLEMDLQKHALIEDKVLVNKVLNLETIVSKSFSSC